MGTNPAKLRSYYGELFGWEFDTGDATTEAVSQPGNYWFILGKRRRRDQRWCRRRRRP